MINYLQFRSNALAGLTLVPVKQRPRFNSSEDKENWIQKEYNRHYINSTIPKGKIFIPLKKRVKCSTLNSNKD